MSITTKCMRKKHINKRLKSKKKNYPYKSGLEKQISDILTAKNVIYEKTRVKYDVTHTYTPDFEIAPNKFIEGKGLFKAADRAKHLYIAAQHPEVQIFFVFGNPNNRLSRTSKTTYGDWATKYGYEWCGINDFNQDILKKWINC